MTQDKAGYYGRVLFDDFPGYFLPWLEHRKRGLVVALETKYNKNIEHQNLIKFNGENVDQIRFALQAAFDRDSKEDLKF